MNSLPSKPEREKLIRRYKSILKNVVDRRPSGVRLKIAERIGKNKSFVSQITNPIYTTPVPEKHLEYIFEAAHFTLEEKAKFLDCYRRAHPRSKTSPSTSAKANGTRTLTLSLPALGSRAAQHQLDRLIRDFARYAGGLMQLKR